MNVVVFLEEDTEEPGMYRVNVGVLLEKGKRLSVRAVKLDNGLVLTLDGAVQLAKALLQLKGEEHERGHDGIGAAAG